MSEDYSRLIQQVQELNSQINNGRGSQVLRSAITWLERGDLESAKAVCLNDRDKLWQYVKCIEGLEAMGLLPARLFLRGEPTPWDLLRVEAIEKFMAENPKECDSVLQAVITWLRKGEVATAQYKIMIDSDKFSDRKKVLAFFNTIDMLDKDYKARMIRAGVIS
jgi:hypothetical protein